MAIAEPAHIDDLPNDPDHVDEWLDDCIFPRPELKPEIYARFVIEQMRHPAWKIMLYKDIMSKYKLFCTFEGKRYRVVMASRLGTLGLNPDLHATSGAEVHAYPKQCTDWSDKP